MKKTRKFLTVLMALVMIVTIVRPVSVDAAAKPKLNKTKVTLTITNKKKNPTVKLKAKNATGKVKWSTSDKKVATVKNGKVTVKSAGKATITCKVNKKRLTCKVTVKDKRTNKNDTKGDLKVEIKHSENMALPYFKGIEFGDNRVVVTYNGKDVTKKADCELIENDTTSYCLTNGVITESRTIGTYLDGNYTLKVEYQGIEKRLKVKIVTERHCYYECYCGTQFYDPDDLAKHKEKSIIDARNNGTLESCECWGDYSIPCCITKVTIVN